MSVRPMLSIVITIFCTLVHFTQSQLIGSRGVIKLRDGYQYRDHQTVNASKAVARFAKNYQPFDDNNAHRRKSREIAQKNFNFQSFTKRTITGQPMEESAIFDFQSSRLTNPPIELRANKPLKEIEIERSTPPARFLPDEKVTSSKPVVQKPIIRQQSQQIKSASQPPKITNTLAPTLSKTIYQQRQYSQQIFTFPLSFYNTAPNPGLLYSIVVQQIL